MNIEYDEVCQLKIIAAFYVKHSKHREAEGVYKAVLSLQERCCGEFSSEVALTCYQLASVYADLGAYVHARPLLERAVQIWESLGRIGLSSPQETIFFMDALVALQAQQGGEQSNAEPETQASKKDITAA